MTQKGAMNAFILELTQKGDMSAYFHFGDLPPTFRWTMVVLLMVFQICVYNEPEDTGKYTSLTQDEEKHI